MQEIIDLTGWNSIGRMITFVVLGLALLILIGHLFVLATTKDAKKKYDYINKNEITLLWYASMRHETGQDRSLDPEPLLGEQFQCDADPARSVLKCISTESMCVTR